MNVAKPKRHPYWQQTAADGTLIGSQFAWCQFYPLLKQNAILCENKGNFY